MFLNLEISHPERNLTQHCCPNQIFVVSRKVLLLEPNLSCLNKSFVIQTKCGLFQQKLCCSNQILVVSKKVLYSQSNFHFKKSCVVPINQTRFIEQTNFGWDKKTCCSNQSLV